MKKLLLLFCFSLCVPFYSAPSYATVTACDGEDRYTGNGSTVAFTYSCKILSSSDLKVLVNGVLKVLTTDYTVSGVGNSAGGTVTFITAPANTLPVTILRNQPVSQLTNYQANSSYNPLTVMRDFDKQTMVGQMLTERIQRTLLLGEKSTYSGLTLPDPVSQNLLRWKTDLTGFENVTLANIPGTGLSAGQIAVGAGVSTPLVGSASFTFTNSVLTIAKNNTTAALVLTSPDSTDAIWDTSGVLGAIRIAASPTAWTRNFLAGLHVVTNSAIADKGRGIFVENQGSISDGIYVNNRGGGVGFAADVEDLPSPTSNSFGMTMLVHSTLSVGYDAVSAATAIGPTLLHLRQQGTVGGETARISLIGNAAHSGLVVRNNSGNASALAIVVQDSGSVNKFSINAQTGDIANGGAATFAGAIATGASTATAGSLRLAATGSIQRRNDANSANLEIISDGTGNAILFGNSTSDNKYAKALVALGGGAAPTLGTIGGSGPATAGQNSWKRELDSTGAAYWIPIWK